MPSRSALDFKFVGGDGELVKLLFLPLISPFLRTGETVLVIIGSVCYGSVADDIARCLENFGLLIAMSGLSLMLF